MPRPLTTEAMIDAMAVGTTSVSPTAALLGPKYRPGSGDSADDGCRTGFEIDAAYIRLNH